MADNMHEPVRFTFETGGGAIAGWRWPKTNAPSLLFCHATGFCASAYKKLLGHVAAHFEIYAMDMRGHGLTTLLADPKSLRGWGIYACDVARFLDAHDRAEWTLAGHSMGGVVAALAARGRSDVKTLRLVEPVAMPPAVRFLALTPFWRAGVIARPPASLARKRKADWPDRRTMREVYEKKRLFARFAPGAIDDYLEDGVRESAGEGVSLSCNTEWEAATFAAHAHNFWGAVRDAPGTVRVLAARHKTSTVFPGAEAGFRRAGASVRWIDGVSHLAPMERPAAVAAFLKGGDA